MIKNYLKIAWRNLFKNKSASFINISGLAVGMAVAILIGLWIYDELSFNRYHKNYDRIVEVMDYQSRNGQKNTNSALPIPLGTAIQSAYFSDFKYIAMVRETEEHIIAAGNKEFTQAGNYMQPEAPDMFSLEMIHGTRQGLHDPHSILLCQTLAKKLFGDRDPIDAIVKIDAQTDVTVTGVFKDLPNNSEFSTTSFILPFDRFNIPKDDWNNYVILIYGQLNDHSDINKVSAKIKNLLSDNTKGQQGTHELFLHPMRKWHLYSTFENHVAVTSDQLKFIWFYGIIGVFVLLLACINFTNLSTARSEKRAKEVGIRKAVGSLRSQLIKQFYGESLLIAFFSFVLSLLLVELTLPWFNKVSDKEISILWSNPWFWIAGLAFTSITGLLAGIYPALYLSSFNSVKALKGTFRAGKFAAIPRKLLVITQFTVSIALIIGTAIVYRQIQYAKDRPVGYSQAGLITLQMKSPDFDRKYSVLKTELLNTGVLENVARANYGITDTRGWNGGFNWEGKAAVEGQSFNTIFVDQEYGKTVGWELLQGRDFSKGLVTDSASIILNESAVKLAGLKNPVGQIVKWEPGWRPPMYFTIIGVTMDMVKGSPYQPTYPSVIFLGTGNWLFAKIKERTDIREALAKIEAGFKKVITDVPFDYKFVDEEYGLKFAAEERIGNLAIFFAALAVFISCLGLFGLASYVAEQRTKEIGIRKVLGASVFNLWKLLSWDFVVLVIISCFIATPVAWYFLNGWLQKYEYRTNMAPWIFAAAGASALIITLITVSFQSIKAAVTNPVKSLRTE
ncbi:MAG TPA: ABC transporter permease [Chitinophagaceae bacterium]|jgi:ABC-type antimicrobial peptide transport system permease subunit|nr:ABC transporter permease [Chitinophagaceae bacterium]